MMKTSCLTLLFLVLSLAGISTQAALYSETGDAGNLSAPQAVNGPYTGLAGNLGGTDTADAFLFHFGGGGLTAFGQLLYPPQPVAPGDPITPQPLFFALFLPPQPDDDVVIPIATANVDGELTVLNLAAGDYIMEAALSAVSRSAF